MSDATAYGSDVSTFAPGLDPFFRPISGTRAVCESLARRLLTPRGALPEDPDLGFDVLTMLSESFDVATVDAYRAAVEAECEKDTRVLSATCSLTFNQTTQTMTISIRGVAQSGPFDFVLDVSKVTVALLLGSHS